MEHMLVRCSYSLQIWWPLLQQLDFTTINPGTGTLQDWWMLLRAQLAGGKRKGFDSLFALTSWQIWKERNARVFRGAESQSTEVLCRIKREGQDWIAAGATHLGCLFSES